jgi:autotransporter translocation and assembly factor TamB
MQGLSAHWDLQKKTTWGLTLDKLSLPHQISLHNITAHSLSKDPSRIALRMARGKSILTSEWTLLTPKETKGILLQSLRISTPQQPTWQLAAPHPITFYPSVSTEGPLCLKSTDQDKVCGSFSMSAAHQWSGTLNSQGFNIMPFFSLLSPEIGGTVSLATDCEAQGAGAKLTGGHCRLHTTQTSQHSLRYKKERIPIEQIDIQLKQSQQGTIGNGLIALSPSDHLHLKLNPTGTGIPQLTVQGQLTHLPFVNTLCDPYVSIEGKLSTDLRLTAQPAGIDAEGTLSLTEGSVQVKPTQTGYHDITVHIKRDDTHTLGYALSGYSNESAFHINGEMDPVAATLSGKLTGENLVISHTPEYQITGTPEVAFSLQPHLFTLQGDVQVNSANIAVKKLSFIEQLPTNDITYIDTNTPTHGTHWKKDMQLNVTLGDQIHLNAYGIQARLAGNINLTGKEDMPFLGNGRIHVAQGSYSLYSKTLSITPGSFIQFLQTPLNNPLLNITASKTIDTNASQLSEKTNENNLIVGVNITGSAQKPKVDYFSNLASLSQSDILTRLLLSSNSAKDNLLKKQEKKQKKDNIFEALMTSLKNTIQSTDFGVQSNNVTDPIHSPIHQQTRYLIGKRITPRLYARYIIGHGNQAIDAEGAQTLFELHYLLSRQFSLLLSSGNLNTLDAQFDTGLDIRYQSQKD